MVGGMLSCQECLLPVGEGDGFVFTPLFRKCPENLTRNRKFFYFGDSSALPCIFS